MYGKVRLLADFFISNITYILIFSMSGRVGIDGGTGGIPQGGRKYPGGPNIFDGLDISDMLLHI